MREVFKEVFVDLVKRGFLLLARICYRSVLIRRTGTGFAMPRRRFHISYIYIET